MKQCKTYNEILELGTNLYNNKSSTAPHHAIGLILDLVNILKEKEDKLSNIMFHSGISNDLDKAITDELNNPPKDIMK